MRGNPELQTEAGRTGFEDPASGKRSMWYHIAQVCVRSASEADSWCSQVLCLHGRVLQLSLCVSCENPASCERCV
jgi:hypothetical protein